MNEQPTLNPDPVDVQDPNITPNQSIDVNYCGDIDELLAECKERLTAYKQGRVVWDGLYYEGVAFYSGRQYFEWNIKNGSLDFIKPITNNALRATINRIVGKCRTVVSHMTSNLPTANVIPNSEIDEDVYAARAGEKWLQHSEFNGDTREVYRETARMNVVFGHSWIKTVWDKYGGKAYGQEQYEDMTKPCPDCQQGKEQLQDPEAMENHLEEENETPEEELNEIKEGTEEHSPCQTCQGTGKVPDIDENTGAVKTQLKTDEQGNPILDDIQFEGEIKKKAITPLHMYYDPSIQDWSEACDCIEARFMSVDDIKYQFPNCEDLTWEDADANNDNPWEMMVNFVIDRASGSGNHGMMVYEFWSRATENFPKGLHLVWVKDKVRVAEPMDTLEGDRLPYSHTKYIAIPGLMRGMGMVEVLKATQTAYNKTISQMLENNQRMNNINWLVNVDRCKIINTPTNEGGQIINYQGQEAPKPTASPSISPMAFNIIKILDEAFDSLSGVPKVAEGITDPSFNSGEQVEAATQNARQIHVPEIDNFVECIADSCSLELRYVQQNLTKETLIKFMGPDGRFLVEKFVGAKLKDNWNVKLMPGSALSQSRASQVKELEMLGQIVMNGQADPDQKKIIVDKLLDFISHGEKERFVSETNRHEMKVRRIINDIKKGEIQDIQTVFMPWHAPFGTIWMTEIENVLDSEDFDFNWPPEQKMKLVNLWESVTMKVNQMKMQAAQQVAQGAPGTPPAGGPLPMGPKPPMAQAGAGPKFMQGQQVPEGQS